MMVEFLPIVDSIVENLMKTYSKKRIMEAC